jgi:hypothetical protein
MMTDAELEADWPDLGIVVRELRAMNRAELADRLIGNVLYASTSGEIYNNVGHTLHEHRALQKTLSPDGSAAWDRVIDRIERIYGGINLGHWLARQWRKLWRTQ